MPAAAAVIRDEQVIYFINQAGRMAYDQYCKRGLDIGSGMVESACKYMIGVREKGPGMCWSVPGAQAVAAVRSTTNGTTTISPPDPDDSCARPLTRIPWTESKKINYNAKYAIRTRRHLMTRISNMTAIETEILRCPHCEGIVESSLRCSSCGLQIACDEAGVYHLLPREIDIVKRQEDTVFVPGGAELTKTVSRPWRRIVGRLEIQRLPQPEKMLNEVFRILRPGGLFVAVDHSIPPYFQWLFSNIAAARVSEDGIQEALVSYNQWQAIVGRSHFPPAALHIYRNPQYQYNPLFCLAGAAIAKLPLVFARKLPVGIIIEYRKPKQNDDI